jgi:hypothetical protein
MLRVALALAGPALLAGCGSMSSPLDWFSSSSAPAGPPAATCPAATVLRPLSQTAVFSPGAQHQPMGVAFYGILNDVSVSCDTVAGGVHVAANVIIIGERGPAAGKGEGVDLPYFVAVTGANQAVLSKRSFAVHIAIPTNALRAGVTDHIEETIPLGGQPPGAFSIVVGFQQGPDVVDFYKHFRGR